MSGAPASGSRRAALRAADLRADSNPLASDYSRFRVAERLLLSGHSHQAWPDRGFEGQKRAWEDAAEHVDEKWSRAEARAVRVREGYRRLLGGGDAPIALGPATHDLLVKWISALPLRERPRLVTTDLEFHALRRQLDRLGETGLEVVKVAALPAESVGERISAAVDDRTAAAFVSAVFYRNGHVAGGLDRALAACESVGTRLLVDAYHALNVLPFDLAEWGIDGAAVTGGGYKYLQLGEGNAFLRLPPGDDLHPVVTGWFAEFDALTHSHRPDEVGWGSIGSRFAGATYDPTSHYRASEVFDFFGERGLTVAVLAESYRHQVALLAERFDALDLDPAVIDRDRSVPVGKLGGFLALESPRAGELRRALLERGVYTDHRDTTLRMGPAPYLSDKQIGDAMGMLEEIVAGRHE
ncbi:MAG TPA: kynureninase [Gemmatimonadota bacterium]|nr:kynureninase [Gemmatimonadota bacterium]